ncbi:hypothetical protein BKA65DRAFT_530322 [Rhexocercosporidium sp. MPI-PUGE-AT-0058]|nr:hypothetical protein BKA65DRAFT_530322 [Rhexocercosporidium sp. MPI-PUGE-AT-0058]
MMNNRPPNPTGPTGLLSLWLSSLTPSDILETIKTRAKYLLLDGVGCALVGAHLPWSEKAAKVHLGLERFGGTCDVVGWEKKFTPLLVALVNGTFIQGFELDDWHSDAPVHSNAIIIPSLFSAAAAQNQSSTSNGTKFTVEPRVSNALHGAHMFTMGWHLGAVFRGSDSAAAVSKMFALDAGAIEDALGIACTQACGLMSAHFESEVKRMQHGFAARNGLIAALLAKGGYVGIKMGLEKEPRFLQDEISRELGETRKIEGVRVKPYAAMAVTHGVVDCVKILQKEHPDLMNDLEGVENVTLGIGAERSLTSMVGREVMPRQFQSDKLERDEIWTLMGKVSCVQDDGLEGGIGATVAEVVWKNGKAAEARVKDGRGVDPELSNEEMVEKWRGLMKGVIDDKRLDGLRRPVLGLRSWTT